MEKLKILKANQLKIYSLQEGMKIEGVCFQKKKDQWFLVADQKKYVLKKKGILYNQITFALYQEPLYWSLKKLKAHEIVGRDPSCSIFIEDDTISTFHFQLNDNQLQDLNSTNGLYCNGTRIQSQSLKPLDHLFFGQKEAYYLPGYLILSSFIKDAQEEIVFDEIPQFTKLHRVHQSIPSIQKASFSLQAPQPLAVIKKGRWFQAVGSSLLIVLSGMISACVVWISSPEQSSSILSLVINSISMGIAFGAFGLWNRKWMVQEKKKENQDLIQKYSLYCKRAQCEIDTMQQEYRDTVKKIVSQYQLKLSNFQREVNQNYRLWIGYQKQEWIQLQYRKPNYLQEQDPLFQRQDSLIQSLQLFEESPVFLKQGESIHLDKVSFSWIQNLFLEWLLVAYQANRKWVWVDASMPIDHPYLHHEACMKDKQKLLIRTKQEWMDFLQDLDESYEYTFLINEEFAIEPITIKATCIYLKSNASIDIRWADFCKDDALFRNLMLGHQESVWNQKQECNILFHQDIWHFSKDTLRQKTVNLKVCLGIENTGNLLYLDFQESKQGPHGFLAGKTGCGKSEMLRNILLQLVLQNSPQLFQYILIDFKGGAFGQYFMQFAHCQGMLTNLKKDQMERFEQSLQAFLEKRQKTLKRFSQKHPDQTSHIDAYNSFYPQDPMAHVFLIVDELAQLKQNFPDFLTKIKEIARIGRSLGVHCILSTQKPLGVMDDQIWANMNFKICMRVATRADSYEVLHSDHAYLLQRSGDFILHDQKSNQEHVGKAWYFQKEVYLHPVGYSEIDSMGNILQNYHQEKVILSHFLSQQVERDTKTKEWIIHPFNQSVFTSNQLALIDKPSTQSIQEWSIKPGQCALLFCTSIKKRQELIQSIAGWATLPIYGLELEDAYLDDSFTEKEFGEIKSIDLPCIWLVNYTRLKQKDVSLLKNKNVILFLFIEVWDSRLKEWFSLSSARICYDFSDIEDIREFFGFFVRQDLKQSPYKGYILLQQSLHSILFRKKENISKKKIKKKAYTLCDLHTFFCIGWDLKKHKEVFWQRKHPLLICYVQQSMAKKISALLEQWQKQRPLHIREDFLEEADIYVLHSIYDAAQFQSPQYLSKIYDLDVCWFGQGIQDYVYTIKRSLPQDHKGDGIYWTEQEVYSFRC